jgi:putative FmdB family regulatory protein
MPLYEYACRECGNGFELRLNYEQRLARHSCPACSSADTVLRLSAPAPLASRGGAEAAGPTGYCPSTGNACGCAHSLRN